MFKAIQTFCVLVVFLLSCHAKNCCYPDQLEFTVKQTVGWADTTGKSGFIAANTVMSFDALGKRIYVNEDVKVGNRTENVVQLQLYEKEVQYTVIDNKTCSKAKLQPWTIQNCIPDNATKTPPFTLGMKSTLKVQDYNWMVGGIFNTITVTSDTCVPVVFQYYGSFPGGKTMGTAKTENVTPGIKNPHVFDVPDICKHIQVIEEVAKQRPMFPF